MESIGYLAALLTSIAFAPQAIKTIKTKSTESISLGTYLIFASGVFCWFVYGLIKIDWPIMLANSVTLFFTSIILIMKLRHG